jgi:hypothetical protein
MERFNDNVAGVALDLNIQVFEDINACVQYPTPTPSQTPGQPTPSVTPTQTVTPSVTPTQTVTPSVTPTSGVPSSTPTNTPTVTPSSTPPQVDPAVLNALWWIDFTNFSSITSGFGVVLQAIDQVNGVDFNAPTNGPVWLPTGYLGVSGATQTFVSPLKNNLGEYTSHPKALTWFGFIDQDGGGSQRGGAICEAWNNGISTGSRVFMLRDLNQSPNYWWARVKLNGGADFEVGFDLTQTGWTGVCVRVFEQSGDVHLEVFENDVLIASGISPSTTLFNYTDLQFTLMYDGGLDTNTEQFWFDKKLSDSQVSQMFTYLNNKY